MFIVIPHSISNLGKPSTMKETKEGNKQDAFEFCLLNEWECSMYHDHM